MASHVFHNFPFNMLIHDLDVDMCRRMKNYFNYQISSADLKARRPLKPGQNVPIVLKFVYSNDKNEIYEGRQMLDGRQYRNKALFITERLPAYDMEIKQACDEKGLIITTRNCQVKVFKKDVNGCNLSRNADSLVAIRQLSGKTLQRRQKIQCKELDFYHGKRNFENTFRKTAPDFNAEKNTPIQRRVNANISPIKTDKKQSLQHHLYSLMQNESILKGNENQTLTRL